MTRQSTLTYFALIPLLRKKEKALFKITIESNFVQNTVKNSCKTTQSVKSRRCLATVNISDVRALTNGNPAKHFPSTMLMHSVRVRSRKDVSNMGRHQIPPAT